MPTTYAIPDGRKHFDVQLSTPVAGGMTFSGMQFKPDLLWRKARNNAESHYIADSNRGTTVFLSSNLTTAELGYQGSDGSLTFNADGYTITDSNYNSGEFYFNGRIYVDWLWKAGGTAVSNTAGSITSSVSANTTAGFSVVTYTGTGANATVGHGLGVALQMVIVKRRDAGGSPWNVWQTGLAGGTSFLSLNGTSAQAVGATRFTATPTSTVFNIGTDGDVNASAGTYVAYCFAPVAGYSAFGSYTGNGSADGPFVYCGFRPRWVMIKCSSSGGAGFEWELVDTSRNTSNVTNLVLYPNLSDAEGTASTAILDITSNGFKLRGAANIINASSATYIFAAFAENPLKFSNAR